MTTTEVLNPEREMLDITWIKSAGPKGGRPTERLMRVDAAGARTLIETLPACDRVRLPDGEEVAGQGGRGAGDITALVPMLTPEQTFTEFLRRENVAVVQDMANVRRAFTEGTLETIKIMRAQIDATQALTEKLMDLAEQRQGDLTEKVVEGVVGQLLKGGGLAGLLGRPG